MAGTHWRIIQCTDMNYEEKGYGLDSSQSGQGLDICAAQETNLDKVINTSSRLVTNITNAPTTYVLTLEYFQLPVTNTKQHGATCSRDLLCIIMS